ncbi:MAG TPA: SDR family oxidoreductase [Pirellulales bacterium]|jgi:nucleoside-diphosphate-sugar epimerase|nr:SDR family oxidoreductase [Pirellulales bacterium]
MSKLIIGCGYLGLCVADQWREAGHDVWVTTRAPDRARQFEQLGYRAIVVDVLNRKSLASFPAAETVLWSVGYDRRAAASLEQVYITGLGQVLDALPGSVQKLIYISSTGVYGDFAGEWVDEDAACQPQRPGGRACLAAEALLQRHALGAKAVVLRLAGIYGPDRLPYLQTLIDGRPLEAPARGFLNLIHVVDAARVVLAAAERAARPCVYLVSDGRPVVRADFYAELARLLQAPPPEFIDSPHSAAAHRASANKRISNARMIAELAPRLAYPSYREGLAAIVQDLDSLEDPSGAH